MAVAVMVAAVYAVTTAAVASGSSKGSGGLCGDNGSSGEWQ